MRVDELCSRETVHIPFSCTLQEAAVQMRDKHVGALVVTEHTPTGPRVVGMVTDRDMVLDGIAAGADPRGVCVGDVMSRGIVTVPSDASASDAIQTMLSHGVRRLAVTSGEVVTGVLSLDDLVAALDADWHMLSAVVRNERERERAGAVQSPLQV